MRLQNVISRPAVPSLRSNSRYFNTRMLVVLGPVVRSSERSVVIG